MATPANRVPVRIARGTKASLDASIADLREGEIVYATDQDSLYVVEGGVLTLAGAAAAGSTDELPEGTTNKYFPEAPNDGKQYARQSEAWVEVATPVTTILWNVQADTFSGRPDFPGTGYYRFWTSEAARVSAIASDGTNVGDIISNLSPGDTIYIRKTYDDGTGVEALTNEWTPFEIELVPTYDATGNYYQIELEPNSPWTSSSDQIINQFPTTDLFHFEIALGGVPAGGTLRPHSSYSPPELITDAPADGNQYTRQDNAWAVVAAGGDVEEAPIDGKQYARQDGSWSEIVASGGEAVVQTALWNVQADNNPIQFPGDGYYRIWDDDEVRLSAITADGTDVTSILTNLAVGDTIYIRQSYDPDTDTEAVTNNWKPFEIVADTVSAETNGDPASYNYYIVSIGPNSPWLGSDDVVTKFFPNTGLGYYFEVAFGGIPEGGTLLPHSTYSPPPSTSGDSTTTLSDISLGQVKGSLVWENFGDTPDVGVNQWYFEPTLDFVSWTLAVNTEASVPGVFVSTELSQLEGSLVEFTDASNNTWSFVAESVVTGLVNGPDGFTERALITPSSTSVPDFAPGVFDLIDTNGSLTISFDGWTPASQTAYADGQLLKYSLADNSFKPVDLADLDPLGPKKRPHLAHWDFEGIPPYLDDGLNTTRALRWATGSPDTTASSVVSTQAKFDGTSLQVGGAGGGYTLYTGPTQQSWSFDCWIWAELTQTDGSEAYLFSNQYFQFGWTDGGSVTASTGGAFFMRTVGTDGSVFRTLATSADKAGNAWIHVSVQRHDDLFSLWIDGTHEGRIFDGNSLPLGTSEWGVGHSVRETNAFNGYLDEVRFTHTTPFLAEGIGSLNITVPTSPYTSV